MNRFAKSKDSAVDTSELPAAPIQPTQSMVTELCLGIDAVLPSELLDVDDLMDEFLFQLEPNPRLPQELLRACMDVDVADLSGLVARALEPPTPIGLLERELYEATLLVKPGELRALDLRELFAQSLEDNNVSRLQQELCNACEVPRAEALPTNAIVDLLAKNLVEPRVPKLDQELLQASTTLGVGRISVAALKNTFAQSCAQPSQGLEGELFAAALKEAFAESCAQPSQGLASELFSAAQVLSEPELVDVFSKNFFAKLGD